MVTDVKPIMNQGTKKRFYSFMFAAVAAFAAASCAQELDNQAPAGETVTFEASVDGAETKAVLDGKVSKWENGDKIPIHNGTKGYEFTTTDEGLKANFSYTGTDFEGDKFMAVYPAGNYTADVAAKTVNAYIPTYQGAREGTYNENAILSVAYTENNSLAFKNACALLKFTVKGEKSIKVIEFYGNNSEAITGNMLVTLNEDNTVKSVEGLKTNFQEGDNSWEGMGTWVKFYSEDEANNWCFKEGVTYYAAIAPANFTKGVALNLILADDTKVEAVKKIETAYNLKANTILDLGELEYVYVEPEHSGWSLPGDYNGWNTAGTFLYEEGDYYVAKNVSGLNKGFKFQHAEFGWKGVGSTDPVAAGQWHKLAGDANISLADEKAYDIYMTKDGNQFQAVVAGSPAPEAPAVVADYWGLIGIGGDWNNDKILVEEGEYLVVKGVAIKTSDSFKFRKNGVWGDEKIAEGGKAKANTEYNFVNSGSSNMTVATAGTYDVYVTKDLKKVYFMTSGKTPDQAGQAQTQTVDIYAETNYTKLWAWLPTVGNLNLTGGSWPGYTATTVSETYNGVTYTKKWTLNVPAEHMGKNLMIIFSGSGTQTADSGPYTLASTMYFTVDDSNKVSQNK